MKIFKLVVIFLLVAAVSACESMPSADNEIPVEANGNSEEGMGSSISVARKIDLGGYVIELESDDYWSWKCKDFGGEGRTLVEFGKISDSKIKLIIDDIKKEIGYYELNSDKREMANAVIVMLQNMSGFVLFDGEDRGEFAVYERKGLNHRWDWGPDLYYSFLIKPNGIGLFYDFTNSNDGKKSKADDVYKCKR